MRYTAWMVAAVLGGVAAEADQLPENTKEIKTLTLEHAKALAQRTGEPQGLPARHVQAIAAACRTHCRLGTTGRAVPGAGVREAAGAGCRIRRSRGEPTAACETWPASPRCPPAWPG